MNLFICITDLSQAQASTASTETEFFCSIEKMIEFGAHSREFIDFVFAQGKEQLLRNAIPKLIENGMKLEVLLDCEKRTIKDRKPEEAIDIINGYIDGMGELIRPEDKRWYIKTYPYQFCSDLIRSANLDDGTEGRYILCAISRAKDLFELDGETCAEYLFSYRHKDDEDAELDLHEGYTPYVEEVERIRETYFSNDYDYDEEEEY